jgi:hypothetical protein
MQVRGADRAACARARASNRQCLSGSPVSGRMTRVRLRIDPSPEQRRTRFRLWERRMGWRLTGSGWFCFLALGLCLSGLVFRQLHPFLALTRPIPATYLVLEGWVPDYAVSETLAVFRTNDYRAILVTGTEIEKGSHLAQEKTYAALTGKTLALAGCPSNQLVILPTPFTRRDRTYHSARQVRQWLDTHAPSASVNVVSVGPHARRTWHLYQLALGPAHPAGVICLRDASYEPERWWTSSQGFRRTLDEWIAFIYARFLFSPRAEAIESDAP